jgi:hypothetical protein
VKLVGGNTSIGITKYLNQTAPYYLSDEYQILIDITRVPELLSVQYQSLTKTLSIGAALSINHMIELLNQYAISSTTTSTTAATSTSEINHESIFSVTAHHLSLIANTQVNHISN